MGALTPCEHGRRDEWPSRRGDGFRHVQLLVAHDHAVERRKDLGAAGFVGKHISHQWVLIECVAQHTGGLFDL